MSEQPYKPPTRVEAIRGRPGMFVGSTDDFGLHNLLTSALEYPLYEAAQKRLRRVEVRLLPRNQVRVTISLREEIGQATFDELRRVTEMLFDTAGMLHHWTDHLAMVAALSSEMSMRTIQNASGWQQVCVEGYPVQVADPQTGTHSDQIVITFSPSPAIFDDQAEFQYDAVAGVLHEYALLNGGAVFQLKDERADPPHEAVHFYPQGLCSYLGQMIYLAMLRRPDFAVPFSTSGEIRIENRLSAHIEFAFAYVGTPSVTYIQSFANNMPTESGSTHLGGFLDGLHRFIGDYAVRHGLSINQLAGVDIHSGLYALISVRYPHIHFSTTIMPALLNQELFQPISDFVYQYLQREEATHGEALDQVIQFLLSTAGDL